MNNETLVQIVSGIFGLGLVWGRLNTRIKQLERELNKNSDFAERLARIEEKVIFISENIKK